MVHHGLLAPLFKKIQGRQSVRAITTVLNIFPGEKLVCGLG